MLSFKPVSQGKSRHVACIEEKSTGEIKELLFFTEVSRDLNENQYRELFLKKLKPYVQEGYTSKDFTVKPEYRLCVLPSNKTEGLNRETLSVFGKSGSGKSWQIKNYIKNYTLMYPGNKVYFYSLNRLENDPSYDVELRKKITQIDLLTVDCPLHPEQIQNSLVVFDDVLDVTPSFNPAEMFGVQYRIADQSGKLRLEAECERRANNIKSHLNKSVQNILNLGRKYGTSCIAVYHKLRSGIKSAFVIEESSACLLYPYTATKTALYGLMQERLNFTKKQIDDFENEQFYQYDFLYINNAGKLFYYTPNRFKIL